MIEFVEGDLFKQNVDALGHGVNCKGVMGAGIAPLFKQRSVRMYEVYKELCDRGTLVPGQVFPWQLAVSGVWVYNMATQDSPGPYAQEDWLISCLHAVRLHAETNFIESVGLPRIGAGIGGLEWDTVRFHMQRILDPSTVNFRIVSLPGA